MAVEPNLAKAVIWAALFFDTCDDDVLDPDTAVQLLEDLDSSAMQMSREDRASLASIVREEVREHAEADIRYAGERWADALEAN